MDDKTRLLKNKEFANINTDIMSSLFDGDIIAGHRAAGSAIITITNKNGKHIFSIRMLSSRGNITKPKVGKWTTSGDAIVAHSEVMVAYVLMLFDINWEDVKNIIELPRYEGQKISYELKDIIWGSSMVEYSAVTGS